MSLTAFNRIRRMQQIEEMKPENIQKAKEEKAKEVEKSIEPAKAKEEKSIVPEKVQEDNFKDEPLVPEVKETKTATRRNSSKK